MSSLLSKQSQNSETKHIHENVSAKILSLQKRMARWASIAMASGVVSLGLIVSGIAMLALGQMPEVVTLVQPAITSDQLASSGGLSNSPFETMPRVLIEVLAGPVSKILAVFMAIMGVFQIVTRQSVHGFLAGLMGAGAILMAPEIMLTIYGETEIYEPTPYAYIQPQLEAAKEASDWTKAWKLLKPMSDTSDDLIVLKAQVAYKAGLEPESVRLIQTIPDTELSAQAWFIESTYADSNEGAGYQLTNTSQKYAENQTSRRSIGAALLRGAAPFGALTFLTGYVAFLIRRNAINIESWLKEWKQ